MTTLERMISGISLWMARIGGLCLLAVAVLISAEVVMRSSHIAVWSLGSELASYALALGATWSLAYVVFERGHVRVDFFVQRLPLYPRSMLDLVALASLAAVGAVLAFGGLEMLATSLRLASRSNTTLGLPLALPHGAWTFGLLWFTAVSVFRLAQATAALLRRDFVEVAQISASLSADDEVEDAIAETRQRLSTQG